MLTLISISFCFIGCDALSNLTGDENDDINKNNDVITKLVDVEEYSYMTKTETTSIEVIYEYIEGEFAIYEFVIENQKTIEEIMTELFDMKVTDYPEDQDIDFYQRWITIKQSDKEYYIHLGYISDDNGNKYLFQSQKIFEIIEKYIKENLVQ